MYTRVRNKALNRLQRASQEQQKRSEGDAEASDGSVARRSLRVSLDIVPGWLLALLMLLILVGGDWNMTLYDFYFPIDWE